MAAILIREIEGGTDSNNRKITVITIRTPRGRVRRYYIVKRKMPVRRRCDSAARIRRHRLTVPTCAACIIIFYTL